MCALAHHRAHHFILPWFTNVRRALVERLGPEFFIRQPVGANDRQAGEFSMQTFHFAPERFFHVQHQHVGPIAGNGETQFFVAAGEMNGLKMLGKTVRQKLSSSDVILIEDYSDWLHGSPILHREGAVALAATANCYHRR